jgi:2,5-diamino-6-(ribosylamino)-4(3H)-pyrimidinone 5'-phosphate reductase
MKPRVIIHNALSADGRMDWFSADLGLYYELAGRFEEDVTLVGSGTLLASPEGASLARDPDEVTPPPPPDPADDRALLVVPDSRGRVRNWALLRSFPYWRGVLALTASTTPQEHFDRLNRQDIPYFIAGREKVDLGASLESLNLKYGAKVVRVDSGGTLNGVLLRAGLVDEVSLLLHPQLVGGTSPRSVFTAPDLGDAAGVIGLKLLAAETLAGGVVWLRYEVTPPAVSAPSGRDAGS